MFLSFDPDIMKSLAPLLASNLVLGMLTVTAIVLVILLIAAPQVEQRLMNASRFSNRGMFARWYAEFRSLQVSSGPFGDALSERLYRDADPTGNIDINTDFFGLVRFVSAALFSTLSAIAIVVSRGNLGYLSIAAFGYWVPVILGQFYNWRRTQAVIRDLPVVLRRLATQLSAEHDIRTAVARVAALQDRTGPAISDLNWANIGMRGERSPFEVLRMLDDRSGIHFWHDFADAGEAASSRSPRDARAAMVRVIDEYLADLGARRQAKAAALQTRIITALSPFLLFSLLLSVLAGVLINSMLLGGPLGGR